MLIVSAIGDGYKMPAWKFLLIVMTVIVFPLFLALSLVLAYRQHKADAEELVRYPGIRRYTRVSSWLLSLYLLGALPNVVWETFRNQNISGPAEWLFCILQVSAALGLLIVEIIKRLDVRRANRINETLNSPPKEETA